MRPELERAGVDVLIGESERGLLPKVYVGEGDRVRPRLESHSQQKDFWTHAAVFTSKDQSLNKAHVRHADRGVLHAALAPGAAMKKRRPGARELIAPNGDRRYVRRDAKGRFVESDDVGWSLRADRRRRAKATVKPGYGDRGDRP